MNAITLKNRPEGRPASARLSARYDAAQTTPDNRRHWANADYLSADAAASPEVRRVLRARCRYEVANNSDIKGVVNTKADWLVGTGPTLQVSTGRSSLDEEIEHAFHQWADSVDFAGILRMLPVARAESGETFILLRDNPYSDSAYETGVTLEPVIVEADQVSQPWMVATMMDEPTYDDGIRFDDFGNPVEYHVLRSHPGSSGFRLGTEYDVWPAERVLHYFKRERPGQRRGIPDLTPALEQLAILRRYQLATLTAAENIAEIAMTLESDASADDDLPDGETTESDTHGEPAPLDAFRLERGLALTMPKGWKLNQPKAEQPTTTFKEFRREVLGAACRCIHMPQAVVFLDSSTANMSARYMDDRTFERAARPDRQQMARLSSALFGAWLYQAIRTDGVLRRSIERNRVPRDAMRPDRFIRHQWMWPAIAEHADPSKTAKGLETMLAVGGTTLAEFHAGRGQDWEQMIHQRAREKALAIKEEAAAGVPIAVPAAPAESPFSQTAVNEQEVDDDE